MGCQDSAETDRQWQERNERVEYLERELIELAKVIARGEPSGGIHAIKAYRAATGSTLKVSKDWYYSVRGVGPPTNYYGSKWRTIEEPKTVNKIETKFDIRDRVIIDGCHGLVGVITAVTWRNPDIVNYEVSWVDNGKSESAIIEGWRLLRAT